MTPKGWEKVEKEYDKKFPNVVMIHVTDEGHKYVDIKDEVCAFFRSHLKELVEERDKYWVELLQAHRPYCTAEGNKILTKIKRKVKDEKQTH
jgi:hypothetical protein